MVIKTDFVTNSSSVCFCGWGITLDLPLSNLPEKTKIAAYEHIKAKDSYMMNVNFTYEYFINNIDEYEWEVYGFLGKYNLSIESRWSCDEVYIGVTPENMPDDKTVGEIKAEAMKNLKDLGFNTITFGYIEEAWRDG